MGGFELGETEVGAVDVGEVFGDVFGVGVGAGGAGHEDLLDGVEE